ncbi:Hypothetical predicted protein [Cloeon dipterum]|uniref:Uncharacterized protein n=1 Tax=Cloeon dipterum TaxID=197152 RepID=A0A8S1DP41_9INSE|nr:Hypothetical predicted protein [Cloeon dipterum]
MLPVISPDVIFADFVKELFDSKENDQDDSYRKDALERAVSPAIKKIDFAQVMDLFPQNYSQIIDVFASITRRAPNISNLQVTEGMLPERNAICISMDAAMVSAIGRMANLKTLKVHRFSLSLSELMGLCRNLPSLEILYFKIEPDREPDFDIDNFEQCFGHLEIFQFSPASTDIGLNFRFRRMLTLECISCLPNIRILGDPDGDEHSLDMLPTCLEIHELTNDEWKSRLTHLTLFLDKDVPEDALKKFPNVRNLQILCDFSAIDFDIAGLLRFQQLSELTLLDLNDMGYLEKLLRANGVLLTHLLVSFKPHFPVDSLEVCSLIYEHCSLRLNRLILRNIDSSSLLSERPVLPACDSLQELELEFNTNWYFLHLLAFYILLKILF